MIVTNSSALILPVQPAATNGAAGPVFHEAPKPLIYIPNGWAWVVWAAGNSGAARRSLFRLAMVAKENPPW